jgi:hypothetical protein
MARIQRIRKKIIDRAYCLSSRAEEEMLDDELTREDIENAILKGRIEKRLSEDIRGTRFICRFKEDTDVTIDHSICFN